MRTTKAIGLIAAICGVVVAATGCGTAPLSEDLETTQEGFNNYVGAPAGYPNAALPFDTSSTRLFANGDWDHTGVISPRVFMTSDSGWYFGAECALNTGYHDYIQGISARTSVSRAHSAKCVGNSTHPVTGAPQSYHYLSRANAQGVAINDRVGSDVSWDWDPGAIKAECGWHQVVTGVAQLESNEIDGIACTSASVNAGPSTFTCQTLKFDGQNHCPFNNCGATDWAPGYYKNLCKSTQFIKGISKKAPMGEISAILCCDWG